MKRHYRPHRVVKVGPFKIGITPGRVQPYTVRVHGETQRFSSDPKEVALYVRMERMRLRI